MLDQTIFGISIRHLALLALLAIVGIVALPVPFNWLAVVGTIGIAAYQRHRTRRAAFRSHYAMIEILPLHRPPTFLGVAPGEFVAPIIVGTIAFYFLPAPYNLLGMAVAMGVGIPIRWGNLDKLATDPDAIILHRRREDK